jgi:hypothetical protein
VFPVSVNTKIISPIFRNFIAGLLVMVISLI